LTLISPFQEPVGIGPGSRVRLFKSHRSIGVSPLLKGRVIDALGQPIDGLGPIPAGELRSIMQEAPLATRRPRIHQVLSTGVRAIDGLLTCGVGQRMGVFAGSGVGKSVTLGMIARNTSADINVIALIGERGREVNEFIHDSLGPEGLAKSIVVVATSDQPALLRVQAAYVATAIAEYFRDQRQNVLLLMDSLTRFALAQREIGLAAGEPPTTRGYPPSVFAMLPRLVERAGCTDAGSITAFYTVLVEGDDANEPISDTVRGLLDGHTFLSRNLAAKGHYPAIDVNVSLSRLMNDLVTPAHRAAATRLRSLLAKYAESEDLISIGAYRSGSNPEVDQAVAARPEILAYLQQNMQESSGFAEAEQRLRSLAEKPLPTPRTAPPLPVA
jgi:FliI/YscN family ATPase